MLSIGLWGWYINITITILDIIHRPVFYLKLTFWGLDNVSFARHGLSLSIVPNWVGYTWWQRQNPVYEAFCFIWRTKSTLKIRSQYCPEQVLSHHIKMGPKSNCAKFQLRFGILNVDKFPHSLQNTSFIWQQSNFDRMHQVYITLQTSRQCACPDATFRSAVRCNQKSTSFPEERVASVLRLTAQCSFLAAGSLSTFFLRIHS
jgi:hypothetical protein